MGRRTLTSPPTPLHAVERGGLARRYSLARWRGGQGVRSIRPGAPRLLLVSECEASREGESDGQVASQEARCSGAGCACWRAIRTV
jgi:hypothetical protein